MHDHKSVEDVLARLMPPALSVDGEREIEAMIDELAGTQEHPQSLWAKHWTRVAVTGGIAAALAAALLVFQHQRHAPPVAERAPAAGPSSEFFLVSESGRVENMIDEGWSDTPDGSAMRTLRLRVVEESNLRDEATGIVMKISQPREELLFMPVSAF